MVRVIKLKKPLQLNIRNEDGASLAELLATIVIFSIIMLFFVSVFISSSKTNMKSNEQVDATYVAQKEMEKIYSKSVTTQFVYREDGLVDLDYVKDDDASTESKLVFDKHLVDDYDITLTVIDDTYYDDMTNAKLNVESQENIVGANTTAEMELLLRWKAEEP